MSRLWPFPEESYKIRIDKKKLPKSKFYLAFEDQTTEPEYFRKFKEYNAINNKYQVDLIPLIRNHDDGKSQPFHVRDGLIEYFKAEIQNKFDKNTDKLWIVIDIDQHFIQKPFSEEINYRNYLKTLNIDDIKINAAVSNPCFELWLILHHKSAEELNLQEMFQNKTKKVKLASGKMKKTTYAKHELFKIQQKSQLNLMDLIDTAIGNAKHTKLETELLNMTKKPGTLVFKIFESIK